MQWSVLDQETTNPREYVKSPFTESKWREGPGSVFTPFLGLQADLYGPPMRPPHQVSLVSAN